MVGPDGKHLGWVGFWFEADNGDGMSEGVENDVLSDSVFAGRTMDLPINTYRNTNVLGWKLSPPG